MVTDTETPIFPPGRYGRRRTPSRMPRWVRVTVAVPVTLAALALCFVLFQRYGNPAYQPNLVGYSSATDHQITFTFRVHKRAPGPAVCGAVAKDRSMGEVGYADVPIPTGTDVRVTYTLPTTARATGVKIVACRAS